ncbi:DUF6356 family protein [Sphingomonas changbaiensis]
MNVVHVVRVDQVDAEGETMFAKLFRDHPAEVGETYGEHFAAAGGFGLKMIAGGAACVVHALVPGLFVTTGSGTVKKLYDQMVAKRAAKRAANIEMRSIEWVI